MMTRHDGSQPAARRGRALVGALGAGLGGLLTAGAHAGGIPGDLNCDNCVNFDDITGFVVAVIGQAQYEAQFPGCRWLNGDGDGDSDVDFDDIDDFVTLVIAGGSGVNPIQIGGNQLPAYPHFEYVRAVMQNAPLRGAIDPTRYPALVGVTADVYVINAGSAGGGLVDVTPGGALAVTFVAGGIQDNTFLLANAGELSGDNGRTLGRGYDIVIDVNRDGQLGCGDYIDGSPTEAGVYIVDDMTTPGPFAVTLVPTYTVTFPGLAGFNTQTVSYPTNIASLGRLPLVAISHGVGHNFQGYTYLQNHLSSYGYIVMAHTNNVGSIPAAADTCQRSTDAFLGNLATIAGGALVGRVDADNIIWIGHSRGGECVALAYDNIFDGRYTPVNYQLAGIKLVSSIAPTAFQGDLVAGDRAETHAGTYHLIYGAADADVSGSASCSQCQSFRLYERATRKRFSTYIQGVGHNDFFCCGSSVASGPALIGRPETQQIAKLVWLALIQNVVEGNVAALDIVTRQWETLRPMGILTTNVVTNEYVDGDAGRYVIDNFQSQPLPEVSSSGGFVTYDVRNISENQMRESDGTFVWSTINPMNGMTRADPTDLTRGVVFDWTSGDQKFIRFQIAGGPRDFSTSAFLSFRAAQITRHPETLAETADLTFTAALEDADGDLSTINVGVYGGGIEETYSRSGGWQNEMETIRIRLTDFTHNTPALDLSQIRAVRFNFGASAGSSRGRIAMDDIEVTRE